MGMRGLDGLSGIIRGQDGVVEMAAERIHASGIEGLDVLASGPRPPNPAELLAHPRFSELLAWAETVYDQILIDSPPALATSDTAVIGRLVDGVVLVVQPEKNRRRLVVRAAESFHGIEDPAARRGGQPRRRRRRSRLLRLRRRIRLRLRGRVRRRGVRRDLRRIKRATTNEMLRHEHEDERTIVVPRRVA